MDKKGEHAVYVTCKIIWIINILNEHFLFMFFLVCIYICWNFSLFYYLIIFNIDI